MCDGIIEEIEASDRIIIISSQVGTQYITFLYINLIDRVVYSSSWMYTNVD